MPAGQAWQALLLELTPYVLRGHGLQDALSAAENVPAGQTTSGENPPSEEDPGGAARHLAFFHRKKPGRQNGIVGRLVGAGLGPAVGRGLGAGEGSGLGAAVG